jgi:type II secretory pathway component PulM
MGLIVGFNLFSDEVTEREAQIMLSAGIFFAVAALVTLIIWMPLRNKLHYDQMTPDEEQAEFDALET